MGHWTGQSSLIHYIISISSSCSWIHLLCDSYCHRICLAPYPTCGIVLHSDALMPSPKSTGVPTATLLLANKEFHASAQVENIYFLRDTRSAADDLAVVTTLAPERLCLCCGLRTDEPHSPLTIGDRPSLFRAASRLPNFVLAFSYGPHP